jgi:soluble lytic murein transglycosylase
MDRQRELFVAVYADVERGNWGVVEALGADERQALENYVLWPDLRAAWFRAAMRTADHAEIEAFLERYGALRPARELRYRYALHLAKADRLAAFLTIYEEFYQGAGIAKLDCLALRAEIEAGREQRVVERALGLWTIGESQVDECDPVFAYLSDNDLIGAADYRRRFELAVEARQFSLARWLGKSIDQQHIDLASGWLTAQRDPEAFLRAHSALGRDETTRDQLVYAAERLTYKDPLLAAELWEDAATRHGFTLEQQLRTQRHIALWVARDNLPGAYAELTKLPVAAQNTEVLRWRARTSLRDQNWANLLADIGLMPEAERQSEEWRYWRGIALHRGGDTETAHELLAELARETSYYGFLAADELDGPYALDDAVAAPEEAVIAELAKREDLVRARELFLVGQDGRGRSEWAAALEGLDAELQLQAAILASRWGWHSRAIAAAASAGAMDSLSLRYPLPFHETFRRYSEQARIPATWAYGVARSESLFMRDVRSRAGAIGLMQLMPATGRQVAREIQLPYAGLTTLTDPQSNIRLGTTYLGQMADRFGGNRVLATAAYNAGPHRVDAWLPEGDPLDARVWIENIPFNETRRYVRRVLEAETIFHWRLTGRMQRLSNQLQSIGPPAASQQVASAATGRP